MSEEQTPIEETTAEEITSAGSANKEKKEKPVPPQTKVQDVYRLIDGEWDEFVELETIDKESFYKAFHREYTEKGDVLVEVQYDQDGTELQKTVNTYNEGGKLMTHELFNEGQFAERIKFELNENGSVNKEHHEFDEGFPLTTNYAYDTESRLVEKRVDDTDGELQKRETFEYHPIWKDKVVKHEVFDEEGTKTLEETTEYEERDGEVKARKIEVRDHSFDTYRRTEFFDARTREDNIGYATFNEKEKVLEYVKVIYDEEGREAEEHSFSVNDSDNFKVFYTYDEYDRVVKQEQHQQDKIISKINRRFNAIGNAELIAVRSFNRGIYIDYFEFEYYQ